MKKKILTAFLIATLFITYLTFWTPKQLAKENSDVSGLALMLPESDVIIALDMNKTLNVVGPSLLSQDPGKIDNLKKLMKSLENTIGINPYEINQIVVGIKTPAPSEKDFFGNMDFTAIFRTAHSNAALLEDWSKKIDAIEAFNVEKEPTEKYIDAFKAFRYYKLSKEETEKLTKSPKEFDEILKKANEVNILLNKLPRSAKSAKLYKDAVKKNKVIIESVNRYQTLLKQDADVKNLRDSSVKLQNRWNEISLDDPNRAAKLMSVLKEAKAIYPGYKTKVENLAKIEALINVSNYEFYEKLSKKNFGLPNDDDFTKAPNDMMKEKLDEIIKALTEFSIVKQSDQLTLVSKNLQRLEDAMNIRLKPLDNVQKFDEIGQEEIPQAKSTKNLSKSIKDNAKISEVNGKKMITIDLDKINFWNPAFGIEEEDKDVKNKEIEEKSKTDNEKAKEARIETAQTKTGSVKTESSAKDKKDEQPKDDKKKALFAIGYLDDNTMVIGFEEGIKSILNRKSDYKNPKAAEMLNSFKNPLISFAMNSKVIESFTKFFETMKPKEAEKKVSPVDKFFRDVNIFGSIEYDGDSEATNDLIMSLGFSKNKVEEIFKDEDSEDGDSVFELGDYQISRAIFYDLLNTLKAVKASVSFKFEKKKLAALIESTPQIIEDIRSQKTNHEKRSEKNTKTKIQSIQNIEDIITSPKFYTDLAKIVASKTNN